MTVSSTNRASTTTAVSTNAKAEKAELKTLQETLKKAGFDPGPIDGVMGKQTREALKGFQEAQGLKADGVIGTETKKALTNTEAKQGNSFDANKHLDRLTDKYNGNKDISGLANGQGTTTKNKDGSSTTTVEGKNGKTSTKETLTTNRKWNGETQMKYESKATTDMGKGGTRETTHKFDSKTDAFGRGTSTQSRDVTFKKGDVTTTTGKATTNDFKGNKLVANSESRSVVDGKATFTNSEVNTKGEVKLPNFMGTKNVDGTVKTDKVAVKDGKWTTTDTDKTTTGTDFKLSSSSEIKDGKFTLKDSADWKKHRYNKESSTEKEYKRKDIKPDGGFSTKKNDGVQGKLDKAKVAGDLLGAAGLKTDVYKEKDVDGAELKELSKDNVSFAGAKYGVAKSGSVTVGADGVQAKFKREASAGLYAQRNATIDTEHGKVSLTAGAKLEAKAGVDAKGSLTLNGLDATATAKIGVSAEASASAKFESKPLEFGGQKLTAGIEGKATVKAEAEAHATGTVKLTRNPPAVVVSGEAGASAVVKAEGEVKVSAGPFSVKASGYASAGAEAKASGTIGYSDGKLKIGGSLGAAVGLGLGGAVNVEVDVKQIGDMAKHGAQVAGAAVHKAADQNGDGKLGLDDVAAGAKNLGNAAVNVATSAAKSAVSSAANTVKSWLPW